MKSKNDSLTTNKLFESTTRPEAELFFKSLDPKDKKLGDIVSYRQNEYEKSTFVIIGCPQDEGVRRNNGRIGAAAAPDKIRQALYRFAKPQELELETLFDLGNTIIGDSLEQTHENHQNVVTQILREGKIPIVLGGGNDISYPDCLALAQVEKDFIVFNIDSHFDVRDNAICNSGTPYRQLLEEQIIRPKLFFEMANQSFANSELYSEYLKKKKATVVTLPQLRKMGIEKALKSILKRSKGSAIFWGIDMDSVRAADAPGVSASYPTGLTSEEILSIAAMAGSDNRSRILEISEVNPKYDSDNRTSKLAALLIITFIRNRLI